MECGRGAILRSQSSSQRGRSFDERDFEILFNARLLLHQVLSIGIASESQVPFVRRVIHILERCEVPDTTWSCVLDVVSREEGRSPYRTYEYTQIWLESTGTIRLQTAGSADGDSYTAMTWSIGASGRSSFCDFRESHGIGSLHKCLLGVPDLGNDGNGYTLIVTNSLGEQQP
jgi:hypothetical protein